MTKNVTKLFGSCHSKLDDDMLPLRFGFQQKKQHILWYFLNIIDHGNDPRSCS